MPLPTFNWIDATNYPTGPENAGRQQWLVTRLANDLFALLIAASGASLPLYKSSDSGVSWSLLDNSLNSATGLGGNGLYQFYTGTDLLLRLMVSNPPGGAFSSATIYFTQFNTSWNTPDNIGGGFSTVQHGASSIDSGGFFEFRRADGSRIIAYQSEAFKVRVVKRSSGGTWSSLALIDDLGGFGRVNYLFNGIADMAGNVHLFGIVYSNGDICNLWHISVDAVTDTVSARHTIDTGLEDDGSTTPTGTANPAATASGRIGISADGTKLAYAYCKNQVSQYSSPSNILLRVAIADLSSTPLSPSFTVETAASGVNPGCLTFGASAAVACSFKGMNDVSVYYLTGPGGGPADLKTQDRTAPSTWSSAAFIWDHTASPALNSPVAAGTGLDGFDLLNAFTNGVGILIGLFSGGHVYTGYIGPTIVASAGSYNRIGRGVISVG